jgi:hypothetical protein
MEPEINSDTPPIFSDKWLLFDWPSGATERAQQRDIAANFFLSSYIQMRRTPPSAKPEEGGGGWRIGGDFVKVPI